MGLLSQLHRESDGLGGPRSGRSDAGSNAAGLGRLYLAVALVGGLAGLVGAAFHAVLDAADRGRALLGPALANWPVPGWLVSMVLGALVLTLASWLVRRFAPETAGSGIQEVESILAGQRDLRWQRVLPVKLVAGALAVGSGLVLGREGPTVHMGSALGKMAGVLGRLGERQTQSLIAAGAGAGLAAAFNAPLAAIVFVTEELREHFEYSFHSFQSVILACCLSVVVCEWLLGQGPALPIRDLATPPLTTAPLFLLLGILIGAFGVLFNRLLLGSVQGMARLRREFGYAVPGSAGAVLGALLWFAPQATGGGEVLVESVLGGHPALVPLLLLLATRTLTSVGSYGLGLPGGIFAPMLALGTIAGAAFDLTLDVLAPGLGVPDGVFAVTAMGALFAATVRAPLTGIVLAIELTGAQGLGLPIILTCLSATFAAQALGGRPIYGALLDLGGQAPPSARRAGAGLVAGSAALVALLAVDWGAAHRPGPVQVASQGADREAGPWVSGPPVSDPGIPCEPHVPAPGPRGESPGATEGVLDPSHVQASKDTTPRFSNDGGVPDTGQVPQRQPETQMPIPALAGTTPEGSPVPRSIPTAAPVYPTQGVHPTDKPVSPEMERYAIQLIAFREPGSVAPFARRFGVEGRVRILKARRRGEDWSLVLVGDYATRQEAMDALDRLPEALRALSPVVRAATAGPGSDLGGAQSGRR